MVSVIIPAKDEQKIFTAITAVKEQDPDEIIAVIEASSDEAYKHALKESDARYVEVEGGTAVARNKGAEVAESDKLVFLDADCYPTNGWLDAMEDALDEYDLVEGAVRYVGERCPFNRIVENTGNEFRFLTANLGVRKAVFEDVRFDDKYDIFREDTDFGWQALDAGYDSTFIDAEVEHDAGRHTFTSFIKERLRYTSEPFFVDRFSDSNLLDTEVSRLGPVLYPEELLVLGALAVSLVLGAATTVSFTPVLLLATLLSTYYTYQKMQTKNARFCPKDWLLGIVLIPTALAAKRYAIWKGALTYRVPVV